MKLRLPEYGDITRYHIGRYHDQPFCVSPNKDLIRLYMEDHRYLSKSDYDIEDTINLGNSFGDDKDQLTLVEWDSYYIPRRDIKMIEYLYNDIESEIEKTLSSLIHLKGLHHKLNTAESTNMNDTIKLLYKTLKSDKKMNKLTKRDIKENSVLFIPMDEYIDILNWYNEVVNGAMRWGIDTNNM